LGDVDVHRPLAEFAAGGAGLGHQCAILVSEPAMKSAPGQSPYAGAAPFLETLISEARRRGFDDFVLLAGPNGEMVAAFLTERDIERRFACCVKMSVGAPLDCKGPALVESLPRLRDDFLLLNGDAWFDFNWLDLFVRARRDGAGAALALRETGEPGCLQTIELDGCVVQAIRSHVAKPGPVLVDGGVQYFTRGAVEDWAARSPVERDILPELAASGALRGYRYSGFFIDIGEPASLAARALGASNCRRPAVFFDRDGVLNVDRGYVHASHQVEWVQGAKTAVKVLNDTGFYVFVVTNQAGVAKGLYGEEAIETLHRWMAEELAAEGAAIDDWRYCPYHPDGSVAAYRAAHPWRKPNPGMLLDLLAGWPVDIKRSFLVGDKISDIEAARAAGMPGYLFEGGDLAAFVRERLRDGRAVPAAVDKREAEV
jgi:D,D-heptose 1,7-bisphosphate phosphatase